MIGIDRDIVSIIYTGIGDTRVRGPPELWANVADGRIGDNSRKHDVPREEREGVGA